MLKVFHLPQKVLVDQYSCLTYLLVNIVLTFVGYTMIVITSIQQPAPDFPLVTLVGHNDSNHLKWCIVFTVA